MDGHPVVRTPAGEELFKKSSPEDMEIAQERFWLLFPDKAPRPSTLKVSIGTVYGWKRKFKEGLKLYGDGILGLLPAYPNSGNRMTKKEKAELRELRAKRIARIAAAKAGKSKSKSVVAAKPATQTLPSNAATSSAEMIDSEVETKRISTGTVQRKGNVITHTMT